MRNASMFSGKTISLTTFGFVGFSEMQLNSLKNVSELVGRSNGVLPGSFYVYFHGIPAYFYYRIVGACKILEKVLAFVFSDWHLFGGFWKARRILINAF